MGYESKLRFGFAGTAKVMTRFIRDAIVADPEFEDALADLVLVPRDGYYVLVNEFDFCKGFSPIADGRQFGATREHPPYYHAHAYARLYAFGSGWGDACLAEKGWNEDDELHGAYLRVGEDPDDVEALWFGENLYMHYSIGNIRTEFGSDDKTLSLAAGIRVREGKPKLGSYSNDFDPPRVVEIVTPPSMAEEAFVRQRHLSGSLEAAIAYMNGAA